MGGSKSEEAETETDILWFPRDIPAYLTQPHYAAELEIHPTRKLPPLSTCELPHFLI